MSEPSGAPPSVEGKIQDTQSSKPRTDRWFDRSTRLWLAVIAVLFCVELYVYGRNGWVQVCVGIEGITDYTLLTTPRADARPGQFPFCAERLNIGMYSTADKSAEEALNSVCGRASALMKTEKLECVRRENGWTRHVVRKQVPPWDPRVYRRLLWLD
jgi:hypothetical protein